jgi:hypothetical protein
LYNDEHWRWCICKNLACRQEHRVWKNIGSGTPANYHKIGVDHPSILNNPLVHAPVPLHVSHELDVQRARMLSNEIPNLIANLVVEPRHLVRLARDLKSMRDV